MMSPVHKHGRAQWSFAAAGFAIIIAAVVPGKVFAQSDDTLMLMNRLNDLEAQVQALSRQNHSNGASSSTGMTPAMGATGPGSAADAQVQMSQLQGQVRTLTGEVETQNNLIMQEKTENPAPK